MSLFDPKSQADRFFNAFRRLTATVTGVDKPTALAVVDGEGKPLLPGVNNSYESKEFTVNNGASDYDVKTQQSMFATVATARRVLIRTDKTITIKFNATGNQSITIASTDSPFVIESLEVTNIFISNASGSGANVKVILT